MSETAVRQRPGACTWCGHRPHAGPCTGEVRVAAGPSGGPGRTVPTKIIDCPCGAAEPNYEKRQG